MYERFYNLRERPFALTPDPEYLYLSRVHREALDSLRYGLETRAGFIVVTGEIGAGKTTLLQTLLRRLDDRTVVARLVNTTLEPRELLEAVAIDFGLDTAGKSKPSLLRDLGVFLVQQRAQERRPLLVVDEAQNLSPAGLEEIRLLSNFETEKSKLLQIFLVGQPNLRQTIASPELEQFRQRVAVSYHLTPLDSSDAAAYINYRLKHAALGEPMRFPADAAELIYRRSGGVPRIINVICDATLVFGYAEERRHIDLALVREVLAELEATGVLPARHDSRPERAPVPEPAQAAAPRPIPGPAAAPAADPYPDEPAVVPTAVQEQALARAIREASDVAARLDARERALAQRERELSEQRRILAEEYRLLRVQRSHVAGPPAAVSRGRARPRAETHPSRFVASRQEGFRGWLKRLLGPSQRALEEN
ncbi:MAG TPA: XrtA/PEP-CTERM system-associated ATPase [Vicinamibacterales bacterium]|nr:XrtA/PEP-CTERM system-associated ATPase [Vicinamibacterales bacterium]